MKVENVSDIDDRKRASVLALLKYPVVTNQIRVLTILFLNKNSLIKRLNLPKKYKSLFHFDQ